MPGYRSRRLYLAASPNTTPFDLGRGLAGIARRARRDDLLHVHGEVAAGLCLPLLAIRPSVVTLHGLNLSRRLKGAMYRAAALNLRAVVAVADRTICVSHAEQDYLDAIIGTAAATGALVVHNGVRRTDSASRHQRADTREQLGVSAAEPMAIWVASLERPRDPLAAIRAAQEASVTLFVVGDGPLRSQVERAASASTTHVLGYRSDVSRLLAAADLFVFTTHREGFAFALLEAMAAGLAPIVTQLPENEEAVGAAGIAVPVGEHLALVGALRRLVDNPVERVNLGKRAQSRVAEQFDAEEMITRTRVIYDDVLDDGV